MAALGVLAVLIGAVVGFLNFRETQRQNLRSLELSRRGQVNERFSKAIDQLGQAGDDKLDVRLGAIYALEQVARDSPDELHGPVMETLTAFLRVHSTPHAGQTEDQTGQWRAFHAIATVMSRRDWRRDTQPLELIHVDLTGARLRGAHLEGASLFGINLTSADLDGAHLGGLSSPTPTSREQLSAGPTSRRQTSIALTWRGRT